MLEQKVASKTFTILCGALLRKQAGTDLFPIYSWLDIHTVCYRTAAWPFLFLCTSDLLGIVCWMCRCVSADHRYNKAKGKISCISEVNSAHTAFYFLLMIWAKYIDYCRAGQGRAGQGRKGKGRKRQSKARQGKASQNHPTSEIFICLQVMDFVCLGFSGFFLTCCHISVGYPNLQTSCFACALVWF